MSVRSHEDISEKENERKKKNFKKSFFLQKKSQLFAIHPFHTFTMLNSDIIQLLNDKEW